MNHPDSISCTADDECQVVTGHCFMGLGGCWYVVNESVSQASLDALAGSFMNENCQGPVCACLPVPNAIGCVEGTCQAL